LRKHEGKQERENKLGKFFSPKNMLLPRLFILLVCFATLASAVRVAFIAGTLFIRFFFLEMYASLVTTDTGVGNDNPSSSWIDYRG